MTPPAHADHEAPIQQAAPSRQAKWKHCGSVSMPVIGIRARALRARGVRCSKAKAVVREFHSQEMRAFLEGKGKRHGSDDATAYWKLYGWKCGRGSGAAACTRGGGDYRTARDYVSAQS